MQTLSRQKGREIVDDIREKNGGISPADRAKTPPSVLRALDSVRRKLGSATQTLATNLYSKDTRFVFELIQNAEDNDYTRAEAAREEAFLIFRLFPDKIIVDSNEDGFMEANVRAICSTGDSTKKTSKGYIGEKGIGFKSVFKVASKVLIQSEPFSFFFEHRRGDDGLGMVTPVFEQHYEIPSNVRTRMTLTLANPSEAATLAQEFYELPETLLLFLNKLKRISIIRDDALGFESEITYSKQVDLMEHRATLTKLSVSNGIADGSRHKAVSAYRINVRTLKSLPLHDARLHSDQAEVVLAFPLDSQSRPIVQQQHVFAFLPIRQVGFSFQIQSDFITQASREDVERNVWNEAILDGVAKAFQDAVLKFCDHPTLQFQWMRYLPTKTISEPFWAQLLPKIVELLKETRVLRPRSEGFLKRPDQLKWVPDSCLDEAGSPLFKDLSDEVYLSAEYEWSDFQLLDVLAVKKLSFWDISTRVRADLNDPSSRWKSASASEEWVTQSAAMLRRPFNEQSSSAEVFRPVLRALPLIPLQGGSWVSGDSGPIFHPHSDHFQVPTDLGLRLVDPQALKNSSRKALLTQLGLRNCVPKDVIALILKKYDAWSNVPLQCSVSHLRYLYWHLPKNERDLPKTVYLKDQESQPVYRAFVTHGREITVDDLYFETDERYEVKQLLRPGELSSLPLELPLHFINTAYIDALSSDARRYDISWEGWLEDSAGARRVPRLFKSSTPQKLSDIFLYIIKRRNQELVGTLKQHWSSYKDLMNPHVIHALREAVVPCENLKQAPLQTTYLPLPKLTEICKKTQVDQELPFLILPVGIDDGSRPDWEFLEIFDVGVETNARFYLDILGHFVRTYQSLSEARRKILLGIYEVVEKQSKGDDRERIREFFAEENVIHVTSRESRPALWTTPEKCVWKAPEFLTEWYSLSNLEGFRQNDTLKHLFNGILNIGDAGWAHYLYQIQVNQEKGLSLQNTQEIYRCLYLEVEGDDWNFVRQRFEERCLVYEPLRGTWHPPESCLWTDDTRVSGKVAISRHYAGLQAFFVQHLGVEEPSIDTYITELQLLTAGDQTPSVEKVKGLINAVNSFEPSTGALERLKAYKVFPVQGTDGRTSLKNTLDLFAIIDRPEYASAFTGKVPILDFDIQEVQVLKKTILALHLEDRYMSQLVVETSTVKDSLKNVGLSNRVRAKAYALVRCAFHYGSLSSRTQPLYEKFQATDVYESEGISKTIAFTLKHLRVAVEGAKGIVHIEEDDQQLRLYVPRDRSDRELCYCTDLPEQLIAQLGIKDMAAIRVVGDVLKQNLSVIDKMLDHHGIVRVAEIEPTQQTVFDDSSSDEDEEQPVPLRATFAPGSAPNSTSRSGLSSYAGSIVSTQSLQTYTEFSGTPRSGLSPIPNRSREDALPEISTSSHEYRALLDHVIRAARRAEFPRPGVPSPDVASDSGNDTPVELSNATFGKRSDGKVSHDVKIGAAGELYAFEFLNRVLPSFDQSNWKSTIRKEVCVHEKYRDMPAWNGRETSDITYEDHQTDDRATTYILTRLLCEHGYLPNDLMLEHEGARIKYYLEVKTTTLGCGTRFFVSKAQYQRMHDMVLEPGLPAKNIYVILRVFNLGQEDMGMRIYVDPAAMEQDGELNFQAETYTVIPAVEEEL